jgi:tetratricopeptide (TPR) repeat protein
MFVAENYFEKDSFNIALNGSGNYPGFLQIIDDYSFTKSANLAHYYAGICYLRTGKFYEAVEQLEKFKSNDQLIAPIALGAQGDAYSELNQTDKAIDSYKKAAKKSENDFTSPLYLMKAAQLLESKKDFKAALEIYNTIKEKYSKTYDGRQIDKFITRAELQVK